MTVGIDLWGGKRSSLSRRREVKELGPLNRGYLYVRQLAKI